MQFFTEVYYVSTNLHEVQPNYPGKQAYFSNPLPFQWFLITFWSNLCAPPPCKFTLTSENMEQCEYPNGEVENRDMIWLQSELFLVPT